MIAVFVRSSYIPEENLRIVVYNDGVGAADWPVR